MISGGKLRSSLAGIAVLSVLALALAALSQAQKKKPPTKPLNLNTATATELEQLPGIGPATAQAIVRFREKSGPFQRVEDLLAIRRISKARLEKLRPYITVGKPGRKQGAGSGGGQPRAAFERPLVRC